MYLFFKHPRHAILNDNICKTHFKHVVLTDITKLTPSESDSCRLNRRFNFPFHMPHQ